MQLGSSPVGPKLRRVHGTAENRWVRPRPKHTPPPLLPACRLCLHAGEPTLDARQGGCRCNIASGGLRVPRSDAPPSLRVLRRLRSGSCPSSVMDSSRLSTKSFTEGCSGWLRKLGRSTQLEPVLLLAGSSADALRCIRPADGDGDGVYGFWCTCSTGWGPGGGMVIWGCGMMGAGALPLRAMSATCAHGSMHWGGGAL